MKKIVALVLSLVMALALCTTAFAADKTYDVYGKDNANLKVNEATLVKAAEPKDGKVGNIEYYKTADGLALVADKDGNYEIVDGQTLVATVKVVDSKEVEYVAKAEKVGKASIWSCTDGLHEAGYKYVDADGNTRFAQESKTPDYNLLVGEKLVGVVDMIGAIPGTHVLYQTKKDAVRPNVYEYKCACCGKTFYGSTYYPNAAESAPMYYAFAGIMATMDFDTFWTKIDAQVTMPKYTEIVKTNMWIWAADSDAAAPANKGTSSPKTFDAGIALYVGMSLMSVAGSAVVIGKKKEF